MRLGPAAWFTGLPGCGKSTIARLTRDALLARGVPVRLLEMDARRKDYIPDPRYTPEERELAYARFLEEARRLAETGDVVLLDAVAHRRAWRDAARRIFPAFLEIHVRCSLETAMAREAARPGGQVQAGLYRRALERRRTGMPDPGLGEVPGVDAPYEENPQAELVLDSETLPPEAAAARAAALLAAGPGAW